MLAGMGKATRLESQKIQQHVAALLASYRHFTGQILSTASSANSIFTAPFGLVSHGCESDPIFNYGNAKALELFEMDWEEFIQLPSRLSTEAMAQKERKALLQEVGHKGYCQNYSGIRISKSGRRFQIENTSIWNVIDARNKTIGQAAYFPKWRYL